MKAIAFNTSPNKEKGFTEKILNPFISGMQKEGAVVKVVYTKDLEIKNCRGCTEDAFFESPGKCLCDDDLNKLYPDLAEADIWIFASPNYPNTISHEFKNLLDRLEPMYQIPENFDSYSELSGFSSKNTGGKVIFISSGGMWEKNSFDLLEEQVKAISFLFNKEFAGSLIRPHSWAMTFNGDNKSIIEDIINSAHEAGRQVAINGTIPMELQQQVSREILPKDEFIKQANGFKDSE